LRCQNSVVETKCGTNGWYDATNSSLRCQSNVVETKCGVDWYNASTQFCYGTTVYSKCGTATYEPETQRCQNGVVENPCGTNWYNASTQFCYNTTVYSKCGGTLTYNPTTQFCDSRDGKAYKWVTIGTQTWMGENLNYDVTDSKCYNNNTTNCTTYGRLYDWATAMNISSYYNSEIYNTNTSASTKYRGICPAGWHIPSQEDWDTLIVFVDPSPTCPTGISYCWGDATKLKAKSSWANNDNGTDDYGFSALPGGVGSSNSKFADVGYRSIWWTPKEDPSSVNWAFRREISLYGDRLTTDNNSKSALYSVRCIKD